MPVGGGGSGEGCFTLEEMRQQVSGMAGAMNHLCRRVDDLATVEDSQCHSAGQTKVGAVANTVSGLAARVDQFDNKSFGSPLSTSCLRASPNCLENGNAERCSQFSPRPDQQCFPDRAAELACALSWRRAPRASVASPSASDRTTSEAGIRDTVETAQTLRQQLAVLTDRMPTVESRSGGVSQSPNTSRDLGWEEAAQPTSSGRHLESPGGASVFSFHADQAAWDKKAPSPRTWLMEPIAVSVGRCSPSSPAAGSSARASFVAPAAGIGTS